MIEISEEDVIAEGLIKENAGHQRGLSANGGNRKSG